MSDSLIATMKRLADLESKLPYPYLVYVLPDMQTSAAGKTDADARFIHDMRMAAPKLLDILGQFEPNDAYLLDALICMIDRDHMHEFAPHRAALVRMCHAASLMEADNDE